ncbi:hypothetical protein HPB52_001961 [Rhipicephalus sanguineus]|uniref:Uncharacterized protein n=1 Tax=Rhipicephalus sanguineus TaxID=34632 RepID=A0A9D4PTN4_RHISA|nr:hypothetical protein HPB52_001961 [Rhipicephalus sanguineus]
MRKPEHSSTGQWTAEEIVWRRLQTGTLISNFINFQVDQGDALPNVVSPRPTGCHILRHCLTSHDRSGPQNLRNQPPYAAVWLPTARYSTATVVDSAILHP